MHDVRDFVVGFDVVTDRHMLKPGLVVYKPNRFIEYDESDHWWIDKYGFGHVEPHQIFRMGNMLIMHPDTLEKIKKDRTSGIPVAL